MLQLNVDTDKVIKFTNQLEKLNKTAFPNAVRNTLNSAAFDVKKVTLQKSADRNFEKRQPNFFKANSRVEVAKGMNIESMEAIVGMRDLTGNNYAVKDLEQQERGGTIDGKSFIPMDPSRTGKSSKKLVQKRNRISGIKNIVSASKGKAKSAGGRLIESAAKAGIGGHVLSEKGILFRVDSLKRNRKGMIKMTPLYSYKSGRSVKVQPTHFMQEAANESGAKLERFYMVNANREFKKVFK